MSKLFKMKIKVIKGHLTPTNKKHLKTLFSLKNYQAKVNNINYKITNVNDCFMVEMAKKDSSYLSGFETSKATFKIN